MTPPNIGPTALEVVTALQPQFDRTASKDEVKALTNEVGRLADHIGRMNGTVNGLCVWQGKVDARHEREDKQPPAPPVPNGKSTETKEVLAIVLPWALRFAWAGAALATGLNLSKVAEVLLK